MNDAGPEDGNPQPAARDAESAMHAAPLTLADALFPVVVKDAAFRPPGVPTYFLVTADGLFMQRETPLFTASVPADGGVPGLQPHRPALTLRIPRLPSSVLARAMGFFRAVYERWRGEAILLMFYAPATRRFALRAPPQVITGRFDRGCFRADLRLDYGACERPGPDYVKLGTFHSHGNTSPAHSSIDLHDEVYEAGLHLTAGYVNSSLPEFAAAFVVGRTRFTVRPDDVLPPFQMTHRPPSSWMQQVTVVCERWGMRQGVTTGGGFGVSTGISSYDTGPRSAEGGNDRIGHEGPEDDDDGKGSAG